MKKLKLFVLLAVLPLGMSAQQTLSFEDCVGMAIRNNKDLEQERAKVEIAGYDRKIAFANYLPNISATGGYVHNSRNIDLIKGSMADSFGAAGANVQTAKDNAVAALQKAIASDPNLAATIMGNQEIMQLIGSLSQADLASAIAGLGQKIDDVFTIDISNMYIGAVTLQQPVFMGGKIVAANKIARLAAELAETQYGGKYDEVLVDVGQTYWQIVSVANKKKLARNYADLLHTMERDVEVSVAEGVATMSDALQIKVKANEADMMFTKADNGLVLSKMLLCKQIGLPLDSEIILADETLESVPEPEILAEKNIEDIYNDRPEIRSLDLAARIYDGKIAVARADMMPTVALMAAYSVTNPNFNDGLRNEFHGGMFSAGVLVNVPIFHGGEALYKTKKAKAEAGIFATKLDDARNLINLQVTQLRKQQEEAYEKLRMAESNLSNAEENMRMATIGFEEGVVPANTALAAQTAWLQAHSEYIDAGVELQMNNVSLKKAEGRYAAERVNNEK